ncbi:MAG: GTPase Era [Candidatus Kapabacteria bacterium]|nr:GTPase Era [Candidatus Kapabacteria bacterium]
MTRCATIAIVGRPNSGKSTLLNAIMQMHLSIVTAKPQTTRKRILGIDTTDDVQLIFLDTPGMLKPRYKLQRSMMGFVEESLDEADIICVVVDTKKAIERKTVLDPLWLEAVKKRKRPTVLVLNKMDAVGIRKEALPLMEEARLSGMFEKAIAISAKDNKYVDELLVMLRELAPEGPFAFDPEAASDQTDRFFVGEFIRESVFKQFTEEVPYATEVMITEFKENPEGKWYIGADVIVERDNQKAIIIGAKGAALKKIGETARATIEEYLGHAVYLELYVKVRSDWRNDKAQLNSMGY